MAVDSLNAGHIDWEHWLNKSRILLEDGLWLSMSSPMEPYPYLASEKDIFNKEHVERREIALAWIEKGMLPKEVYKDAQAREYLVPPVEFFSLAEQAGWIDPLNREHDPIFKFLHSIQTLRAQWLCSKPAYVTREELGEIFHGTRVEWEFISAKMENDILQGRLSAEIAVKKGNDFKVIESITERRQIRNGWLGGGWVNYTMKTADAAAWFKGKYEIPADSMLGRLFGVSTPFNSEALAPALPSTLDSAAPSAANAGGSFLGIKRFKDDWARLIDDTAKVLFTQHNGMPNEAQMWQAMIAKTVPGYHVQCDGGYLTMPDNNPLSRSEFGERWKKLMAKQQ